MHPILPTLCVTALLAGSALAAAQIEPSVPLELAERLAGPGTNLFIGELPPRSLLSFDLPLPEGTRILGSSVSDPESPFSAPYRFANIYLEVPRTSGETASFYRRAFNPPWRDQQSAGMTGFLPAGTQHPTEALSFCRARTTVYLELSADGDSTYVNAHISIAPEAEAASWCQENSGSWVQPPLPALLAPEDSTGSNPDFATGSTPGQGSSSILLETDASSTDLARHYAEQLQAAGWEEVQRLETEALHSSSYRFTTQDAAYLGTLQVMQVDERSYLAQVAVFPNPTDTED